jgi:hypothetical protein
MQDCISGALLLLPTMDLSDLSECNYPPPPTRSALSTMNAAQPTSTYLPNARRSAIQVAVLVDTKVLVLLSPRVLKNSLVEWQILYVFVNAITLWAVLQKMVTAYFLAHSCSVIVIVIVN